MAYSDTARARLRGVLDGIREAGLYKEERIIHSPQHPRMEVEFPAGSAVKPVLNMCANNYLGLSNHPEVIEAADSVIRLDHGEVRE